MATSERIFITPPGEAKVQTPAVGRTLSGSGRPVWVHALIDFVTVLVVLRLAEIGLRFDLSLGQAHRLVPHVAIASMVLTFLAFAGAYPRMRTPLDIASAEGLVKATVCAAIVFAIERIGWRISVTHTAVLIGIAIAVSLVVQRSITNAFFGRSSHLGVSARGASNALVDIWAVDGLTEHTTSRAGCLLKRSVDLAGAALILILVFPLGVAVALLIKLDSKGPVFLRQKRIGRYGTPFYMWKFRSMRVGVSRYARSPVSDRDPRLTRIGRGLRRLSIDELPQLLNVLKGEMSLVGPRPEMPFIVKDYTAFERLRLHATPGITGLWQISPARSMPIHKNVELDLFYIRHRSFFLDTAIMIRTVTAVVRGIGAN